MKTDCACGSNCAPNEGCRSAGPSYEPPFRAGLREMKAAAKPGECPFCGDPLKANPKGRKSHTCGDDVCRTAWMRCWKRDQRRLAQAEQQAFVAVAS